MADWNFAIVQDGLTVAEGSGPDKESVLAEAAHYVRMYGQEGDCMGHVWEEGCKPPRLHNPGQ